MTEIRFFVANDVMNEQQNTNPDNEIPSESMTQLFTEQTKANDEKNMKLVTAKQNKRRNKLNSEGGNEKITCEICGVETTYRDYDEHEKTEIHKLQRKRLKQKERKERKKRAKENKKKKKAEAVRKIFGKIAPDTVSSHLAVVVFEKEAHTRDRYHIRHGNLPPRHHLQYINSLTVFLALRYALNSDKNFKISIINSKWNEFGDIVIELENGEEITEVQAIQCKQVQYRNTILLSFLGADMGKFSLKARYEILKKLQKRSHFEKTYFKLYTVSNLTINKDTFTSFVYDESILGTWKNKKEKEFWRNREIVIPEYKKVNFLNTTDEPDDICNFKIINHDDQNLNNTINRFSMFTNQKKLDGLQNLIKSVVKNRFDNSRDISSDVISFVDYYFKVNTKNMSCLKLTKKDFLLKVAELLLEPYLVLPEVTTDEKELELWNNVLLEFDVVVIRKHPDILRKIFSGLDYRLSRETQYSLNDDNTLKVEKSKVSSWNLYLELFDGFDCNTRDLALPELYLAMWKIKLIPLVLQADDEKHLSLINKVLDFLKEQSLDVKFVILTNNLKIDRSTFSKNLDVFLTLQDLKAKNYDIMYNVLKNVEIDILDFAVTLENIVECNENFLEKVTPDALLNMCLDDYSFQDIYVPMTDEIIENTLVLRDEDVAKIGRRVERRDSDSETDNLSYVISIGGKPTQIHVPPEL